MKVVISWSGIPLYAAKLIKVGIEENNHNVKVLGVNLQFPKRTIEGLTNCEVLEIHENRVVKWSDIGEEIPDIFFQSGWSVKSFVNLGLQVKKNGGKVILCSDNCWKNNFRQYFGFLKFTALNKSRFCAVWVPGKSGKKLMRFWGFKEEQIYTGLYGSDEKLFFSDRSILERDKSFIFVGQLINRKGISTLLQAFQRFHHEHRDWNLKIYGRGELENLMHNVKGVDFNNFASPEEIALALRSSRFLVLPSLEDHWPLVVSEASLSGCGLILSDKIGNSEEFLTEKNGFSFRANSSSDLYKCFCLAAGMKDDQLATMSSVSLTLGAKFQLKHWKVKFNEIIQNSVESL